MSKCRRCLIPEAVEGVELDRDGTCNLCIEFNCTDVAELESARKAREADLEQALRDCRGKGEYDCLVPLSGGKDSIFLLHKLKAEYGLNILALTTDANIPKLAWDNIRRTISTLDIDHISFKPAENFYKKLFRYLLKNQEARGAVYTVSYVYAPLFEGDAIKLALEKQIPIILAGYSPGQPEPERMLYEFSRELICDVDWAPPGLQECSQFSSEELARFFNPMNYPPGEQFPRYLAPFHAWPYSQDEVMKKVVELGLVAGKKHASPIYSNYPINWLLMYSDLKHFGYNPYAPEFSALIREGKANRAYWKIMGPIVNSMILYKVSLGRNVSKSLKWLDLDVDDLKITLPRGAYDPVKLG